METHQVTHGIVRSEAPELQGLANELSDSNLEALAESINQFMVSVSEELPRLQGSHPIFHEKRPLPADLTITVEETERAPTSLKVNKATGPDNIPAWVLMCWRNLWLRKHIGDILIFSAPFYTGR